VDTVEHAEMVEKELDAMIERHSRQKDPDKESELWRESLGGEAPAEGAPRMARLPLRSGCAAQVHPAGAHRAPRGRGGGVGSCVLRFFGFPDFVTGL